MSDAIDVSVEVDRAARALAAFADATPEGARRGVHELAILAEGAMKREAPSGAGVPDVPLQNTIAKEPKRPANEIRIMPHKRTTEGWLLAKAIVGSPNTPQYTDKRPAVWTDNSGRAQGRLAEWAAAKLGNRSAAFAVANKIKQRGEHKTFPNPFVARSVREWRDEVASVTNEEVADALSRASPG